jgi:hypothetical protein
LGRGARKGAAGEREAEVFMGGNGFGILDFLVFRDLEFFWDLGFWDLGFSVIWDFRIWNFSGFGIFTTSARG